MQLRNRAAAMLTACGVLAFGAHPLRAGGGAATGTDLAGLNGTGMDWGDAKAVAQLVKDLGSDDFAVREANGKKLDAAPFGVVELVRQLAEQATDVEVKARLAARVEAMEAAHALNPPLISLDVNQASLAQVAAALSSATGVTIQATPAGVGDNYTLSVKDKTFFQVIEALCRQHPLWFGTTTVGMRMIRDNNASTLMQSVGGVCVSMNALQSSATAGAAGAASVRMIASMSIVIDPRIGLTAIKPPVIDRAVDQAGHSLGQPAQPTASAPATSLRSHVWTRSLIWTVPPDAAAAATDLTISGTVALTVLVPDVMTKTVVENAKAHVNEPIKMGELLLTLKQLELGTAGADGMRTLTVGTKVEPDMTGVAPAVTVSSLTAGANPVIPLAISIVDAKGKVVFSTAQRYAGPGASDVTTTVSTQATEPLRLEISAATKTKEVTVPFEIKKVPIQ